MTVVAAAAGAAMMLGKLENGRDGHCASCASSSIAINARDMVAPTIIPASAPRAVVRFHHTPRRKTGVKAEPATAKAHVTINATLGTFEKSSVGTARPIAAATDPVTVTDIRANQMRRASGAPGLTNCS